MHGDAPCDVRQALVARVHGRRITKARAQTDYNGNVVALVLKFDDGQELAIDPEVNGDRIMVTLIDER